MLRISLLKGVGMHSGIIRYNAKEATDKKAKKKKNHNNVSVHQ